ncbi:MAG: PEP-utilizing enzyme, partial [Acidimicrobiales bacterium]
MATWPRRDERTVPVAVMGDVLQGLPGCPGRARGIARVIASSHDPGALEPGDVLVAEITDPSWTPLFVPSAAVVVNVGAPLSHAIIVSRELGIPCVVSVTDATKRIPDGALVEVDGDLGTVTILGEERDRLTARWEQERGLVQTIKESKAQMDALKTEAEGLEREGDFGRVAEIRYGQIPGLEADIETASASLRDVQQSGAMLKEEVDAEDIADVVARATGIPVSRMLATEREKLLGMEGVLAARVVGQPEAVEAVANAVRRSRAGLQERHRPLGSFIFL